MNSMSTNLHNSLKKILFSDINVRIGVYLSAPFVVSLISSVIPVPATYFSLSSNVLNQVFVKNAWAWNIILLAPFISLTSYVYGGGRKKLILKHQSRLLISILVWKSWTKLFNEVLQASGKCVSNNYLHSLNTVKSCSNLGYKWDGFDISGHSFILVFGSLMIIEEVKPFLNWENIRQYIELEKIIRTNSQSCNERTIKLKRNPIRHLTNDELVAIEGNYRKCTEVIGYLFIIIASLQMLWDLMLFITMIYFHNFLEKMLGCLVGVISWHLCYNVLFRLPTFCMPGNGYFRCSDCR